MSTKKPKHVAHQITYMPPQPMFATCPTCGLLVMIQVASWEPVEMADGTSVRMPVYVPHDPPLSPVLGEPHVCTMQPLQQGG
jgi:hypothetical protein